MPTRISILGATGSIGRSTLDVLARHGDRFQVQSLSGHSNVKLLARQCCQFKARAAVISDSSKESALREALTAEGCDTTVVTGPTALNQLACDPQADVVMAAIVGAAGLEPTLTAVQAGKKVLLANKESMVIAGPLFHREVAAGDGVIIPVDSEHNALFQSLPENFQQGLTASGVKRLILTASGGPFLHRGLDELGQVTPQEACAHPNWNMGRKISVDSATLMNKGLEVIEARWLFNADPNQISVVIHPQSIVHSMVEYDDGSVLSQMGLPDMRTPIAHALAWPERITSGVGSLSLPTIGTLEFFEPDLHRFPCLRLAFDAMQAGGSAAATLNAANEVAVQAFLDEQISFMRIPEVLEETMNRSATVAVSSLEDIIQADAQARRMAANIL